MAAPDIKAAALQLRKRERHELESYDEYSRVVAHLDDATRVIECRDRIQWIVQRRSGHRWNGVSFCRTKEALLWCSGVRAGGNASLDALPDRFPEAAEANTAEMADGRGLESGDGLVTAVSPSIVGLPRRLDIGERTNV
ncbi:hypothetical protein [Bradyrhizobium lablabi]|uniref:hypothetical protein n=1 Tax=Bradyrhizobium lablabi TaxID=722472 RepID=UPI001BA54FEA|nr:hypothetical protein [Bradyrhizobium lablabi]MBR0696707.1 hypothetical protein [Bradyrhizobium lablabi]